MGDPLARARGGSLLKLDCWGWLLPVRPLVELEASRVGVVQALTELVELAWIARFHGWQVPTPTIKEQPAIIRRRISSVEAALLVAFHTRCPRVVVSTAC